MALSLDTPSGAEPTRPYLRYDDSLEVPEHDEQTVFDELSRTMQHLTRTMAERYRHAYRPVHAKSHGVLVGYLEVVPDLPPHLAQGLFARTATHPVVMRFSTNPGDLLADSVSSPRGLAVKVLDVSGDMVANHAGKTTQDLVVSMRMHSPRQIPPDSSSKFRDSPRDECSARDRRPALCDT